MQIRSEDLQLINLILSQNPTQSDLDDFLSNWDLEVEGADKGLLLAVFKQKNPHLIFSPYAGPRLDGLIRYFRFQNINALTELKHFHEGMSSAGIPYLVMGDTALRIMSPGIPRFIRRVEVAVSLKNLRKSKNIASRTIDVRVADDFLFAQSVSCSFAGIDVMVPSEENLIYRLLLNLEYGVVMFDNYPSLPRVLMQVHELLHSGRVPNWDNIIKTVKSERKGPHIHTAIECYSQLTRDELEDFSIGTYTDGELCDYNKRCAYVRDVLRPCRASIQQYRFDSLVRSPRRLLEWLVTRIKLKFIKIKYKISFA